MDERERSPLFCASLQRKGKLCRKLGHNLADDGRRFCRSHIPDDVDTIKSPIRCQFRLKNDDQCTSIAEQIVLVAERDTPGCHFHARRWLEREGQPEPRRTHGRANGQVDASADGLDLADLDLGEEVTGTLRQRLAELAHSTAGEVLRDSLAAERVERVRCPHCKRTHRHVTKDHATRLGALKLLLGHSIPAPKSEEPEWLPPGADLTRLSTRELRAVAFGHKQPEPEPEQED